MDAKKDWTVGELLGTSSGYWRSCALHAGVRLELFTILGDQRLAGVEIARLAKGDARGIGLLLNGLAAMGLIDKSADAYANTDFSRKFLDRASGDYLGHIILHHHHLVDGWAQLDEAVRSGRPVEMRSYGEEAERESFLLGMFNLAMGQAPRLAAQLDLKGRKHLLDLGGGPGTYAIHFCLANPGLRATIFDRPTTEPFARRTAARFAVDGRIDFQAGDFNVDPIAGRYDVAWLSQILHSNGYEECERLLAKTVAALEPGGLIMIHEFILDDSLAAPLFPALFSLNMLINNPDGRSYAEGELRGMLTRAGVTDIRRLAFTGANDSGILCGVR